MIDNKCFTTEWIETKAKELNYSDTNLTRESHPCAFPVGYACTFGLPVPFQGRLMPDASAA